MRTDLGWKRNITVTCTMNFSIILAGAAAERFRCIVPAICCRAVARYPVRSYPLHGSAYHGYDLIFSSIYFIHSGSSSMTLISPFSFYHTKKEDMFIAYLLMRLSWGLCVFS